MLDSETRRRIDTARDILVGKVPDPKSQVEQITIALIYKFMDDMDAEAEELGGTRQFFAGEFERYGWAKLMRSGLGGFETLNLYAEAITRMPQNPGIPPLFRDIFKNAFLPYRDPETLRSFLKVIDEFSYDHSERLGDAFEYLLSVLGSQGDAGQFRTPRHIIDFIVAVVDPKKGETVLDPACGTAGFLISSYKHILRANRINMDGQDGQDTSSAASPSMSQTSLTPDERGRLAEAFKGYDISPDMVRLSLVNMYLHGFADPHIVEYDTLTSQERWNEYADVILANPPFMSPKGGIRPHNRFSVQSKRSEVLFVDYMAEHLTPRGRAGIIVPEGVIFQSQTAYTQLRKMLVEGYLVAVVSLPAGVFNPYSGVKTSILILDRALARQSDSIAFFKIENDGFGLGAQRRPIDKDDLPDTRQAIREYLNMDKQDRQDLDVSCASCPPVLKQLLASGKALVVAKARIAAKGEYNLSGERYRTYGSSLSVFPLAKLGDLCEINPQSVDPAELFPNSFFHYIDISCVENESGKFMGANRVAANEAPDRARRLVAQNDVLISTVRPNLKAFALLSDLPERAIASTGFAVLRAKPERILPGFLIYMLRHENSVSQMIGMMGKGAYPSINQSDVDAIEIPLPPLDVQREMVAEIEGYQRVIDGARAVVAAYRPHIPVDAAWPLVEIGPLVEIYNGFVLTEFADTGTVACIKVSDMNLPENRREIVTSSHWLDSTAKPLLPQNSIVFPKRGAAIGTNKKRITRIPCLIDNNCMGLTVKPGAELHPDYLFNFLLGFDLTTISNSAGIALINNGDISSVRIPLPPPETQEQIVAEIDREEALVAGNRELIRRFEGKIAAALARVWGEDAAPARATTEDTE